MSFVPAAELSRGLYDAVLPALQGIPHAAALLGWGSDVLGFATERSTDHGWGPRLVVLVEDPSAVLPAVEAALPSEILGWPVRFGWDAVAVQHHVTVASASSWLTGHLGVDPTLGLSTTDWLLLPQQRILGVVAGVVHHDSLGALTAVRRELAWFPDQVWRWLVACQWHRLAQEEAFVARTAEVGDDLGSRVVAARLVRDMMRLALLLDRRYAPYAKWLGTAFLQGAHPDDLPAHLAAALDGTTAGQRETALGKAWVCLGERHIATGLTAPVGVSLRDYHSRPAQVLMADRFTQACLDTVTDPELLALPMIGSIDQVVDSTDVLQSPAVFRSLAGLYDRPG